MYNTYIDNRIKGMEISVIRSSQAKLGKFDLANKGSVGLCNITGKNNLIGSRNSKICFSPTINCPNSSIRFSLKASALTQSVPVQSEKVWREKSIKSKPNDGVKVYVGLPLDSVSDCNTVNHARAIAAGIKALKLLGVDGVELPVWWGIAEKETMGKYEWSGYLALAEMIQKAGLKLHVSLCFHASKESKIPLPKWVSQIGEAEPSIFFMDRSSHHFKECLSLAVDDLPVLNGKTPIQVYKDFCESFKTSFSPFLGSTITGISVGLGPDGELRYPSYGQKSKNTNIRGAGEFQCYDKNMINHLMQQAETFGNPLWGLCGPHDAPSYDESPISNNFFKENWGSWETPYGDFFLSWYSSQLISHGDRLLSLAASTFSDAHVIISGKVPLVHSWYRTRSHSSELTAGFYNTDKRDGYEEVVEMFSRNSSKMILPGMDLSDDHQPNESLSSPESLLEQITTVCRKRGVKISSQNSMVSGAPKGFEQIKKHLLNDYTVDLFTYQRMGAEFFSPDHFPSFTAFIRSLNQQELHSDDLPINEEESLTRKNLQTQAA